MFVSNKYTNLYYKIIENAKNRINIVDDILENHHIIPKSLGGNNKKNNLVLLTPREHFVCHHLLLKMCIELTHKSKMYYAFFRMKYNSDVSDGQPQRFNSKHYQRIVQYNRNLIMGVNNHFYGKTHTDETKKKISEKVKGKNLGNDNHFYGKTHTDETKKKMSIIAKKRIGKKAGHYGKTHKSVTCEYCGKIIKYPMYRRWHGKNCKKYKKA